MVNLICVLVLFALPWRAGAWDLAKFENKEVLGKYFVRQHTLGNVIKQPQKHLAEHLCSRRCIEDQTCSAIEVLPDGSCQGYRGLPLLFTRDPAISGGHKVKLSEEKAETTINKYAFLTFEGTDLSDVRTHTFSYGTCSNPLPFHDSFSMPHDYFREPDSFTGFSETTQTLAFCGGEQDHHSHSHIKIDDKCYLLKLYVEEFPTWSDPLTMHYERKQANTHTIGHLIYIYGGLPEGSDVEVIDTIAETIQALKVRPPSDLGAYFFPCAITLDDNKIVLTGGATDSSMRTILDNVDLLDLAARTWTENVFPSMNDKKLRHACAKIKIGDDDHLLTLGGRNARVFSHLSTIETLNLNKPKGLVIKAWTVIQEKINPIPSPQFGFWPARGFIIKEFNLKTCDLMFLNLASNDIWVCTGKHVWKKQHLQTYAGDTQILRRASFQKEVSLVPIFAQRFLTCP